MISIKYLCTSLIKTITARMICASGMNVLISIGRYTRNRVAYLHLARFQPCEVFLFSKLSFGIDYLSKATSNPSISSEGMRWKLLIPLLLFYLRWRRRQFLKKTLCMWWVDYWKKLWLSCMKHARHLQIIFLKLSPYRESFISSSRRIAPLWSSWWDLGSGVGVYRAWSSLVELYITDLRFA